MSKLISKWEAHTMFKDIPHLSTSKIMKSSSSEDPEISSSWLSGSVKKLFLLSFQSTKTNLLIFKQMERSILSSMVIFRVNKHLSSQKLPVLMTTTVLFYLWSVLSGSTSRKQTWKLSWNLQAICQKCSKQCD